MIAVENQFQVEEAQALRRTSVPKAPARFQNAGVDVEVFDAADAAFGLIANTERFPRVARQGCGE
ncbi:MAG: hypothetical protein ACYTGR_02980 [Planctomycetota bacterium]|jgi:hypothetical protein